MKSEEKDNEVLEHYGDALYMLGKNEAVQFWEKAIKGGKDSEILKEKSRKKIWNNLKFLLPFLIIGLSFSCRTIKPVNGGAQ